MHCAQNMQREQTRNHNWKCESGFVAWTLMETMRGPRNEFSGTTVRLVST